MAFFDTLVSLKLTETASRETGAKIVVLNLIEGLMEADKKCGKNYLAAMRKNLLNLKKALEE
jgi:zinc transport system substrate-binding protein